MPVALPDEVPVAEEPPAAEPDDEPIELDAVEVPVLMYQPQLGLEQT